MFLLCIIHTIPDVSAETNLITLRWLVRYRRIGIENGRIIGSGRWGRLAAELGDPWPKTITIKEG